MHPEMLFALSMVRQRDARHEARRRRTARMARRSAAVPASLRRTTSGRPGRRHRLPVPEAVEAGPA